MTEYFKKYLIYGIYTVLVIYSMILVIFSLQPKDQTGQLNYVDKFIHFGIFGILSIILYYVLLFQNKILLLKKYPAVSTLLVISLVGLLTEFIQLYIPGRTANVYDWIANFLGSLISIMLIKYSLIAIKRIKQI